MALDQSSSQNYREMVDTNILGVYYCMKHEITQMLRQGKGAIVNLASIAGLNGIPWRALMLPPSTQLLG